MQREMSKRREVKLVHDRNNVQSQFIPRFSKCVDMQSSVTRWVYKLTSSTKKLSWTQPKLKWRRIIIQINRARATGTPMTARWNIYTRSYRVSRWVRNPGGTTKKCGTRLREGWVDIIGLTNRISWEHQISHRREITQELNISIPGSRS